MHTNNNAAVLDTLLFFKLKLLKIVYEQYERVREKLGAMSPRVTR